MAGDDERLAALRGWRQAVMAGEPPNSSEQLPKKRGLIIRFFRHGELHRRGG
jgi:hypothetical protein